MVLMALDHARDYFGDIRLDPTDLETTTPALFFTRWVTHFCAPVFVFLAGTSAWLRSQSRPSRGDLSRYLLFRGLWLVFLELTVVSFAWILSLSLGIIFFQVIAAIGVAMIALAGLIWLPHRAILIFGILICAGHPMLATVQAEDLGWFAPLWPLFYGDLGALPPAGGIQILVIYSCLPWIGVMALGYGCAPLFRPTERPPTKTLFGLGLLLVLTFVVLRATVSNHFLDPQPWLPRESPLASAIAFLNCSKYPPSPLFLAMTLGPAAIALAILETRSNLLTRGLATFGRVPLFYYILHILVIHLGSWAWNGLVHGTGFSPMQAALTGSFPPDFDGNLFHVYGAWCLLGIGLYFPCRGYAKLKREKRWKITRVL